MVRRMSDSTNFYLCVIAFVGVVFALAGAQAYVGQMYNEAADCTQRTDAWYAKYYSPVNVALEEMRSGFACGLGEKAGDMTRMVSDATLLNELQDMRYDEEEARGMVDTLRKLYGEAYG